jgi:cation-transporting ATPase 13A3/4/5
MSAYFKITFSEWCWIFMDGVWTITLAFSLPLAKSERTLAQTRPTSSLLGPLTMSSALGILGLNFTFTVIALAALFHQDWFQCRKWNGDDVSDVLTIGDNYETEVIFLVTGCQYMFSAMAFNFGYEWRQAWIRNYMFVVPALAFVAIQFYITLVPGRLSCFWRVNCENDDVVLSLVKGEPIPIQNPFNTTVMPLEFRWFLIFIMIANGISVMAWDFFAVNKTRQRLANDRRNKKSILTQPPSDSEPAMVV